MTLTIEISSELEAKLEAEAKREGLDKTEFVRVVLEERLNAQAPGRKPPFPARIIATDVPVRDRSRENAWLARHRDEYDGKYVALDGDTLLACSENAKEVAIKARELGVQCPFIVYVEGRNRPRFISGGVW
jgi:hypothetical protein